MKRKWIILKQRIAEWWLNNIGYHFAAWRQQRFVKSLEGRNEIRVAFVANNVAMWKYQSLYDRLQQDQRFKLFVILSPSISYQQEHRMRDLLAMRTYFSERKMDFVDWKIENGEDAIDIRKAINPDIVFYTQPYHGVYHHKHCFLNFTDRLLCYYPYAFLQIQDKYIYDQVYNNIAWKIYLANDYSRDDARMLARNKGRNVVVVGYPSSDLYQNIELPEVWKDDNHSRKRLIWAPHFTVANDGSAFSRSNFLYLSDFMLQLADKYKDKLQIAFKPHPSLLRELYNHPEWGPKRTDDYYNQWNSKPNTQLETGDYVALFSGSDAMVHDSGSFIVDYQYFRKPVMYVSQDIALSKKYGNDFSKMAYDQHYIGKTYEDIERFIVEVVLEGNDTMKSSRDEFYSKFLLPPNGRSVADNTYDDIVKSIGL